MNIARDQLQSFVDRIENADAQRKAFSDDIRDIYTEAKGSGFDTKALREIVKIRKQDADKRREHEAVLETYMHALGMLADLPLGQAALTRLQREPAEVPLS